MSAFIDSGKAGSAFFGFPVHHPDVLDSICPESAYVLICTTNPRVYREISDICSQKGITCHSADAMILKLRRESFLEASALLDGASQSIYHALLYSRAAVKAPQASICAGESYFGLPEFCRSAHDDVILDCGAYVGDSAERYIWRMEQFKKYIAIEPDRGNYGAMLKRFARLREEWNLPADKLIAIHAGVDEATCTRGIQSRVGGLGSIAVDNETPDADEMRFLAIDDLIHERFTFLKADIESYEYRMLLGGRQSIRRYLPRMAICIYHSMVDMYSIPLLVHSLNPGYRLSVRHHSYGYEETVLYAY